MLRLEENSSRQPAIARAVEKKRKIVKMSLILVILFGINWLPYHLYFIVVFFVPGENITFNYHALAYAYFTGSDTNQHFLKLYYYKRGKLIRRTKVLLIGTESKIKLKSFLGTKF